MKKKIANYISPKKLAVILLATIVLLSSFTSVSQAAAKKKIGKRKGDRWGVFIGAETRIDPDRVIEGNYKYIVIDAQNYSADEIMELKKTGCQIYSYLSIGSIANYRSYYKEFRKFTLGKYHNWPDERWVDVTQKSWRDFIVEELVAGMVANGVDGMWVDNTDVYYQYHRDSIFNGLVTILKRIHKKNIPIIINGGDVFVKKLIAKKKAGIIDGIMQEEVLTLISGYNNNHFKKQRSSDRKYLESYFKKVKKAGLYISVLEYTKKSSMKKSIEKYCDKNGYGYYICDDVMLK